MTVPPANTSDMPKVHTMFRREFGLLPGLARGVAAGDIARSRIVADHIEFLCTVLEAHHQSEDESLWPKLLDRGSEEVASVVHLMEGHHQAIEKGISDVRAELAVWLGSAASERREALGEALDPLVALLEEHMGLEEERILPMVEAYVTAVEWEEMVRKGAAHVRPEDIPLIAGMVMYEAGADFGPPEIRVGMREMAPQAFASYSKRIHGTATPRRSTG